LAHLITQDDSFTISLLIGTDYYWDLVKDHSIRGNGPTAMISKLGYLLSGPLPTGYTLTTHTSALHVTTNCDLRQFWELESTGTNAKIYTSTNETFLLDYSNTHVSRQPDGSYCAKLPWKPVTPLCQPIEKSVGSEHTPLSTTWHKHQHYLKPITILSLIKLRKDSLRKSLTLLTIQL